MSVALYFHTIRHLQLGQIFWRLRYRFHRPVPNLSEAPLRRAKVEVWTQPCERKPCMTGPQTFIFLNDSRTIANREAWNDPAVGKLWLYNLHYFDDLNAEGAEQRRAWHQSLITRWVAENPPAQGNGWEPYPCSLRIVNWIKFVLNGGELPPPALASLAIQVRYLFKRLEFHLLGNHLLANAKALVFAGAFFAGEEAAAWLAKGKHILQRQLAEQVLADGAHFELSPMYHCLVLEDLLDIENICAAYGQDDPVAGETIARMRTWLAAMCHPDGGIAFFNDAAFEIAPSPADLNGYAERLGCPALRAPAGGLVHLVESGYFRVQRGEAVLLGDAAAVGPDYLPGHAHADTLSFELSLHGQRVMVNSGTSCYGSDAERQRQRGTAAHNTLVIDGADSSEVWGGFRVARRARVRSMHTSESAGDILVEAEHDGYRRLPGHNLHRRSWSMRDGELKIRDKVQGAFTRAEVRFHLHPAIVVSDVSASQASLRLPGGETVEVFCRGGRLAVETDTWHPGFGMTLSNHCLVGVLDEARIETIIRWGAHS